MNSRKTLYDVKTFYDKGGVNKASYKGMRYLVKKEDESLIGYIYPDRFCFEKTPDNEKIKETFPATEEGLDALYEWLVNSYEKDKERWESFIGFNGIN